VALQISCSAALQLALQIGEDLQGFTRRETVDVEGLDAVDDAL
jgi:hypothetical protein